MNNKNINETRRQRKINKNRRRNAQVIIERKNGHEFSRAPRFIRLNKRNQHNFARNNTFDMTKKH
jgi:hypothetical protein